MAEAVDEYYKTGDLRRVDVVLKSILDRTTEYLINSTPKRYLTKVMAIWNSIPVQLTKENKKFMYGYVDPKARAREYEASVDQIVRMGVVRQVCFLWQTRRMTSHLSCIILIMVCSGSWLVFWFRILTQIMFLI